MKKKILTLLVIVCLIAMLFILTGCGDDESSDSKDSEKTTSQEGESQEDSSTSPATELEAAMKEAINAEYEEDEDVLVKNVQERLDDRYTILGVNTASGDGILSVKDYIDPSTTIPARQAAMSITKSADFLIVYDSKTDKEFRVALYRQTTPPYVSCTDDSEIAK